LPAISNSNSMQATVAVIVVTWNASHLIKGVLEALSHQTLRPVHTLLIDNDSDDADRLHAVAAAFPDCETIMLSENIGFAAANNLGIQRYVDVEFIALLNPDAYPEPEWLERLVTAARQYPDSASFGSRMLDFHDPSLLDGAGDALSLTGMPGRRGHRQPAAGNYLTPSEIFSPCAAAALYRAALLNEVRGFDPSFFCYVEDVDLGFRLRLAGYSARYVPDSQVRHIGSAITGRRSEFSVYHGQRNLVINFLKNMPLPLLCALLVPHIAINLAYILAGMLSGRGLTVWRAKRDALLRLPATLTARKEVQRQRRASSIDILRALSLTRGTPKCCQQPPGGTTRATKRK